MAVLDPRLLSDSAFKRWETDRPRRLTLDTETNTKTPPGSKQPDFDRHRDRAFCVTFSWDGKPEYIEVSMTDPQAPNNLRVRQMLEVADEWVFHNAKFDLHVLLNGGMFDLAWLDSKTVHDTELLSRLHFEHGKHGLKPLARDRLFINTMEETALKEAKERTKAESYDKLPRKVLIPYALEDARITELLFDDLYRAVCVSWPEKAALYELERELLLCLFRMETAGMGVDPEYFQRAAAKLSVEVQRLERAISKLVPPVVYPAGSTYRNAKGGMSTRRKEKVVEFNPNSGPQVAAALQARGIQLSKLTDSGELCTDATVLGQLDDELAKLLLELRQISKLSTTYLEPLARKAALVDGNYIVKANFRQAEARTGRMSCAAPNLQNIPRSDKRVRGGFLPKLDALLYFDFSNIELRVAAAYSRDETMLAAFNGEDPLDLHTYTAQVAQELEPTGHKGDVSGDMRDMGKTLNFSMSYGAGAAKLQEQLAEAGIYVTLKQAGEMVARYWEGYPGLAALRDKLADQVEERGGPGVGYIKTLLGRHLHPDSPHKQLNALIQGSAADLMKLALVRVEKWLRDNKMQSHLVSVVHDELQIDAVESEISVICQTVPMLMTDVPQLTRVVRLAVDTEITRTTWAAKQPYEQEVGPSVSDRDPAALAA